MLHLYIYITWLALQEQSSLNGFQHRLHVWMTGNICGEVVLYRLPHFRSVQIFNYFKFQVADVSIRYRLLLTYNKTYEIIAFCQD